MFLEPLPGGALLWTVGTERQGPRGHEVTAVMTVQLGGPEGTRKPVTLLSGQVTVDSEHVTVELAPSLSSGSRLTFAHVFSPSSLPMV